jgi:zinc transport system substrate-binding protein
MRYVLSLILLLGAAGPLHAAAPRVVVSIVPLHSLVAGVMAGVGEPRLLIPGGQSPHHYSLRPSRARALARAQLVLWVGAELEASLARSIRKLARGARVVTLMRHGDIRLLEAREGGVWEDHQAQEAGVERHHHGLDPHLWLSPDNAGRIVRIVRDELIALDPGNADRYRDNAGALLQRIADLDRSLRERLEPLRGEPYLVFHDAYQYFERHYGLRAVGSVTVSPERPPGARRLHQLRGKIRTSGARCVFAEPQFRPGLVRTLIEGSGARGAELDPLGAGLQPGADAWFRLMEGLAGGLVACLGACRTQDESAAKEGQRSNFP